MRFVHRAAHGEGDADDALALASRDDVSQEWNVAKGGVEGIGGGDRSGDVYRAIRLRIRPAALAPSSAPRTSSPIQMKRLSDVKGEE